MNENVEVVGLRQTFVDLEVALVAQRQAELAVPFRMGKEARLIHRKKQRHEIRPTPLTLYVGSSEVVAHRKDEDVLQ